MTIHVGIVVDRLNLEPNPVRGPARAAYAVIRRLNAPASMTLWAIRSAGFMGGDYVFEACPLELWRERNPWGAAPRLRRVRRIARAVVPTFLAPLYLPLWKRIRQLDQPSSTPGPSRLRYIGLAELGAMISFFPEDEAWKLPIEKHEVTCIGWFWDGAFIRLASHLPQDREHHRWQHFNILMESMSRLSTRAKRLICCSHSTERDLHAYWPHSRGKTDVVYLGQDVDPSAEGKAPGKRVAAATRGSCPYVLFLSGMSSNKNIGNLLAAVGELQRRQGNRRVALVMAGENIGSKAFHEDFGMAIRRLRRSVDVSLLGFVSDAEANHLMRHAAVLAVPSLIEGFGLPIVEAMALGCPVACSDQFSSPEVGGDCVWLFDPYDPYSMADALQKVLDLSPDERSSARERGRARAAMFTWERTALGLQEILERELQAHGR